MLIHVVADYGAGDLAFAEVAQRLALHVPGATLVLTPVPAFDTISAGFCVAQLALGDGPPERVVFHNVAPRADAPDPRPGNQGERLLCARLGNGVVVLGPNSGYTFSFVAGEASVLREVRCPPGGSQFRSRDFFPEVLASIVGDDDSVLGDAPTPGAIAELPTRRLVYVDGYGNLKTSWFESPAEEGQQVEVTVGGQTVGATVTGGAFEVPVGELAFAPGSSGWVTTDRREMRFFEVFLRGGSAAERFGRPRTGAVVDVQLAVPRRR